MVRCKPHELSSQLVVEDKELTNVIAPTKHGLSKAEEHASRHDNSKDRAFKRRRIDAATDTISTFQPSRIPDPEPAYSISIPDKRSHDLARADNVKAMLAEDAPQLQACKAPHLQFPLKFQLLPSATELTTEELNACFDLIYMTSGDDYKASSIGWNPKQKKDEMQDKEMMYLLVRQGNLVGGTARRHFSKGDTDARKPSAAQSNALVQPVSDNKEPSATGESISPSLQLANEAEPSSMRDIDMILGFISFMFTHDDPPHEDRQVVYIYEVHLHENLRGRGLGSNLVGFVEKVARRFNITKTMLTVYTSNCKAQRVYKRLGYTKDECSPKDRVMRRKTIKAEYLIMSKELL